MGARTNQITLVLCLLVLASAIAVATEPLVPPVFGVKVVSVVVETAGVGSGTGFNDTPGTLVVQVKSTSAAAGDLFMEPYVTDAGVSVVPAGVAPLFPLTYYTNTTGEVRLQLTAENYSVSFFDLPMNVSVPAQVRPGMTTDLQLTVTSNTYREEFLDMPTNQSGVVPAWSHGTMELASSAALLGSSAAFLDLYYGLGSSSGPGQVGQREIQAPLLITSTDVRSNASLSDQWIAFQPETPISLTGLTSVGLSVYGEYSSVVISGGGSS